VKATNFTKRALNKQFKNLADGFIISLAFVLKLFREIGYESFLGK
jgi:hypothetical protein